MAWRPDRALVLALALAVAACAPDRPAEVDLAELAFGMERYDGSVVETVGVVREFTVDEHDALLDHFVLEDDRQNRVELVPHEAVAPYVGEHVRVVGRFTAEAGRVLEVDEIEAQDRPADLLR